MVKPKNVYKKASLIQLGKFLRSFLDSDSWPGYQCGVDQREFDIFQLSIEFIGNHPKPKWFPSLKLYYCRL